MRLDEILKESVMSDAELFATGLDAYAEDAITHVKQIRDEWSMNLHWALKDAIRAMKKQNFLEAEKHIEKAIQGSAFEKENILEFFEANYGKEGLAAAERFLKGVRITEE